MTAVSFLKRLQAPMGHHAGDVDGRVAALLAPSKAVLNIGAKSTGRPEWINLDIVRHSDRVTLLGDANALPFRANALDGVVMRFVLEHVPDPWAVVAEAGRALKPGGLFFATVPFVEPFHADPGDYHRFTLDGLARLFSEFEIDEKGVYYGPASALVEVLREFVAGFSDTAILKKGLRFAAGWLFWPLKYLDVYLGRKKGASVCAYGLYVIARKKGKAAL